LTLAKVVYVPLYRLSAPHRVYFPVFHSDTLHEHYVDSVKWFSENIVISKVSVCFLNMKRCNFYYFFKSADHVYCIWKFVEGEKEPNILFRWNRSEKSEIILDVRLGLSVTRKVIQKNLKI